MYKEKNIKKTVGIKKKIISPKTKQKNRRRGLLFLLSLFFLGMSVYYLNEIKKIRVDKTLIVNKNMFLLEQSFLVREQGFYMDKNYLKRNEFLKKDWLKKTGGIKFNEQPKKEI